MTLNGIIVVILRYLTKIVSFGNQLYVKMVEERHTGLLIAMGVARGCTWVYVHCAPQGDKKWGATPMPNETKNVASRYDLW